ncbi:zinc knuckle, partial [Ostertagia ostertagi]
MSDIDEPMEDSRVAELERLLLEEPSASDQIASLKASVDTLVGTVKEIAHKSALQVRISHDLMLDKVQTFRDVPKTIIGRVSQALPLERRHEIEEIFSTQFDNDLKALEGELNKLTFVCERLRSVSASVDQLVPVSVSELLAQAEYDDSCMRQLALLLKVDTTQVVEKVSALLKAVSAKSETNTVVPPHVQAESVQVPQQATASSSAASNASVIEQLNRFEFDNLEYHATFDPIAAAQGEQRSRQNPTQDFVQVMPSGLNEVFQPEKRSKPPQRQKESLWKETVPKVMLQGECNRTPLGSMQGFEMARMFAALTLPDVKVYNDPNGREFGDFLAQFRLKYQGLGLDDDMLVHLLFSKLDGFPRSVAEALPRSVKVAGFKAIVEALQDKFRENESSTQMNAYMKLKTLRMEKDVTSYCVELEKITQRAYPEASEKELSRTRASELVAQLSNWPEYLQLYTTMELAPKEHAYEMVKSMAQRCERSRALAIATKKTLDASKSQRSIPEERGPGEKNRPQSRQKQDVSSAPTATQSKDNRAQKRVPKCFKCNECGHFSRDCKKSVGAKLKTCPKTTDEASSNGPRVFTASLNKEKYVADGTPSRCEDLVGERMTTTVRLLGISRTALLDTGSQISIIPLEVLRAGQTSGFDFDEDVEQFPLENTAPIFDASGNKMQFEGAVRLTLELEKGERRRVALFVKAGRDDTLVLGTNALKPLGVSLITKGIGHTRKQHLEDTQCKVTTKEKRSMRARRRKSPTSGQAVVTKRTYLRPGETKMLPVRCAKTRKEGILWSKSSLVPNIICHKASHSLEIPITNDFAGAKIFREGEEVGTYEPVKIREAEPVKCYGDMLERTADVIKNREENCCDYCTRRKSGEARRSDVFAVTEQELTQTTLVEHSIETGDAKPIKQKARPIPLSTRVELRQILGDLQGRKKKDGTLKVMRGLPEGEPGNEDGQLSRCQPLIQSCKLPITCNVIYVSRTLLGVDNALNLRHRCPCGLFGQMAHVALPGLTHPMARSKKVHDMFQLANVASIAEQACWGDERKEEELRKKSSCYITPYGLALAVDAHRRRCHTYAEAVENAKGQRFEHPAVFPWPVPYDLGAHLTTAIALQGKLRIPGTTVNKEPEIFIALPPAFGRVNADVDYADNITPYVYADWSALAHKLISMPIVTSIIIVWPDTTPESRQMRQVLIALERHLQPGGSLAFFPSPYEDDNNAEWTHMGRICAEYVRYMTAPQRVFEAIVRDHYSDVLEGAPYTHPAGCLGTHPRRAKCQFGGYQIRLFLDKLRLTVNDLIKMDEFEMASPELRDRRRQEKLTKRRRRREERMPNFYVIEDPNRTRHHRSLSFRRPLDKDRPSSSREHRSPVEKIRRRSHSPRRAGSRKRY